MLVVEQNPCSVERLRDYPGCFEDCDIGDTNACPHHKKQESEEGDDPSNIQGTLENFEKERQLNKWDDEQAKEIWDKHYR